MSIANYQLGQAVFSPREDCMGDDSLTLVTDVQELVSKYRRFEQEHNERGPLSGYALVSEERIVATLAVEVDDDGARIEGYAPDDLNWFFADDEGLIFVAESCELVECFGLNRSPRGQFTLYGTKPDRAALYKFVDEKLARVTTAEEISEGKKYFREIYTDRFLQEVEAA
jgi:hypothetical protein